MLGFGKHVRENLSAYCHEQLPPEEARRVAEHLAGCESCRREYAEIRLGAELASHLSVVAAPETLWRGIEQRLDAGEGHPARFAAPAWWRPVAAFALLLLAAGPGATWYYQFRERLRIQVAATAPTAFEAAASEAHRNRLAGEWAPDYVTTQPRQLQLWIQERIGIGVSLADPQPEDAGRIQLLGARIISVGRAQAAVVGYTVDSRPVTLVTARASVLDQALPDRWYRKDVRYRDDAVSGHKVLTWASGGQAYVLVSDLPEMGQRGCFVCHVSPERRELILNARPRPQNGESAR